MKLKDQLVLREVAGQYVIVPTGERVREIRSIVYISSSAAYLWDYMQDCEFSKDDLVARVLEHFSEVSEEQARADIEDFLKVLEAHNILDDNVARGQVVTRLPKKILDRLWPPSGSQGNANGDAHGKARGNAHSDAHGKARGGTQNGDAS